MGGACLSGPCCCCSNMFHDIARKICLPQRFLLTVMCFLAVANAYTMRVCLNIAITVMVTKQTPHNSTRTTEDPLACPAQDSGGASLTRGEFSWDEATQGLILSSFFWGYILTHIPGGILANKFGGKYTLLLGILSTSIFTLLTPVVVRAGGSGALLALRFLEGLGEGSTFPAINMLLANWLPPKEKSGLGSFAFSGSLIGTVVCQSVSGLILHATDNDWPLVFYFFGVLALVWCALFQLFCYNSPQTHPFITDKELGYLAETIEGIDDAKDRVIPWGAILRSVPLWGLIVAQVGHDWVFFSMVTDLPKYLSDVLKFSIKKNGYISALPYLVMLLTSILSGYLCDVILRRGWMTTTGVRKFFTTVATIGPAGGIIGASYAGCDQYLVMVMFTIAMAFMGAFYPGIKVNTLDLSPNFAGILMAIVNGSGALSGIITPYLIGALTPDSSLLQWRTTFWISVGVAIFTNIVYLITGSGELQPWNAIPPKE